MHLKRVGLQKTTLIDYPDMVASTVFTHGCNLHCPYCHNPELVAGPLPESFISIERFFMFLEKRKTVLDGVCITGGEPLLYDDLPEFIERIHHMDLKVKLDTNGTLPEKLEKVVPDYIAMDLKTVPDKYTLLTGKHTGNIAEKITASLEYLKTSGIDFEIRTTWAEGITEKRDIPDMAEVLDGVEKYYITPFRPGITLDPSWNTHKTPSPETMKQIQKLFQKKGIKPFIRG